MARKSTHGYLILVQELDRLYRSEYEKESFILRKFHDVSRARFLKEKENWEKQSSEAKILFN